MANKVKSPRDIKLKTSATTVRNTKPRTERIVRNNQDSTWKSGLAAGTSLENYKLDIMRLS